MEAPARDAITTTAMSVVSDHTIHFRGNCSGFGMNEIMGMRNVQGNRNTGTANPRASVPGVPLFRAGNPAASAPGRLNGMIVPVRYSPDPITMKALFAIVRTATAIVPAEIP